MTMGDVFTGRRSDDGMTLIEVLAALALSAALVATLLTVSSSLRGDQQRMDQDTSDSAAMNRRLARLFEHDLTHARTLETVGGQVQLVGYGGLDREALKAEHRRTLVTYQQVDLPSGGAALVREQVELDNTTNRASTLDVVALGVATFAIESESTSDRVRFDVTWDDDRPPLEGTLMLSLRAPSPQ